MQLVFLISEFFKLFLATFLNIVMPQIFPYLFKKKTLRNNLKTSAKKIRITKSALRTLRYMQICALCLVSSGIH